MSHADSKSFAVPIAVHVVMALMAPLVAISIAGVSILVLGIIAGVLGCAISALYVVGAICLGMRRLRWLYVTSSLTLLVGKAAGFACLVSGYGGWVVAEGGGNVLAVVFAIPTLFAGLYLVVSASMLVVVLLSVARSPRGRDFMDEGVNAPPPAIRHWRGYYVVSAPLGVGLFTVPGIALTFAAIFPMFDFEEFFGWIMIFVMMVASGIGYVLLTLAAVIAVGWAIAHGLVASWLDGDRLGGAASAVAGTAAAKVVASCAMLLAMAWFFIDYQPGGEQTPVEFWGMVGLALNVLPALALLGTAVVDVVLLVRLLALTARPAALHERLN